MAKSNFSEINFATILASSVHDMKNSLCTLREQIKRLADRQGTPTENDDFIQLEFETSRMNNSLMQLLILYKMERAQFSPTVDEYPVIDILNEIFAQQGELLSLKKINLEIRCPDELYCYCDSQLVSNAISTILNNAQRYSNNNILLAARAESDFIQISIEDDGLGYPDALLISEPGTISQVNFDNGNTGLGLFFAANIAAMHMSGSRQGYIKTDNTSCLGGAKFSLYLP